MNGTYVAGDVRATENPGLSSLHTIFLREHNRIAGALGALDATLSDEELYQRTRRYRVTLVVAYLGWVDSDF